MIGFVNIIDIARPPADVFSYLADLEHIPEWNRAIGSTEKIGPGPVGIGTTFRQVRLAPRRSVELLEITELQPPRRITVAGKLGPFDARLSYELLPISAGTRLSNAIELEADGPLGFFAGALSGRIKASVAENLRTLKGVLEQDRPQSE